MSAPVAASPLFDAPAGETLAELRERLHVEALDRAARGQCGCGCGDPIDRGGNGRRVYREGHRQRAHRHRLELEAQARGIPPRLSIAALDAPTPTPDRNGDAQRPRRKRQSKPRSGVSIYIPTVAAAELAQAAIVDRRPADDDGPALELWTQTLEAIDKAIARRRARA